MFKEMIYCCENEVVFGVDGFDWECAVGYMDIFQRFQDYLNLMK